MIMHDVLHTNCRKKTKTDKIMEFNSQDLSSQVLKTNTLETQDTYRVNGTMKGVGNISETGTYVSTFRPVYLFIPKQYFRRRYS